MNKKNKFDGLSALLSKNKPSQDSSNNIIFKTTDKAEYENKLLSAQQSKLLSKLYTKASYDNVQSELANLSNIALMYRDADLMDAFPEIGAGLDIISEESTIVGPDNKIINITSSSKRVRDILDDLFTNRLDLHMSLPMISRATCKYGNNYQLLNISPENGVLGWKQLPVYEIKRSELGENNHYSATYSNIFSGGSAQTPTNTQFVWVGRNEGMPYSNWQVAHFRLLLDSLYLPYGVSWLHKARRHWRMLSTMEDMMLLYRLERSVERRVFKINVGSINEEDVEGFVNDIADKFKRTSIFDPQTGQIDLRKNYLDVSHDYFIPVRNDNAANPIETLSSAQNITSMDDINYMQHKILSALRLPKAFLNFENAEGSGQNLSILDIRFNRTVNKVQQCLLLELNKIAIIHLYLLGLEDELHNFSLSLNNPSPQMEMLELDNLDKKIRIAQNALSDPGNGIQIMSWSKVQKDILKLNSDEIVELLNEIRVEQAVASELERTSEIIKRTGVFNSADRMYGEIGADYSDTLENEEGDNDGFGGDGGFGGDMDFGESDMDGEFDFGEDEDDGDVDSELGDDITDDNEFPMEKRTKTKNLIIESPSNIMITKLKNNGKKHLQRSEDIMVNSRKLMTSLSEAINKFNNKK